MVVASVGEQTEGGKTEHAVCALFLQLAADIDHGFAGRDHIVHHDRVFSVQILSEVLMRFNRVSAVDNNRIVAALVEHTDVQSEHRRIVHTTRHRTFVG